MRGAQGRSTAAGAEPREERRADGKHNARGPRGQHIRATAAPRARCSKLGWAQRLTSLRAGAPRARVVRRPARRRRLHRVLGAVSWSAPRHHRLPRLALDALITVAHLGLAVAVGRRGRRQAARPGGTNAQRGQLREAACTGGTRSRRQPASMVAARLQSSSRGGKSWRSDGGARKKKEGELVEDAPDARSGGCARGRPPRRSHAGEEEAAHQRRARRHRRRARVRSPHPPRRRRRASPTKRRARRPVELNRRLCRAGRLPPRTASARAERLVREADGWRASTPWCMAAQPCRCPVSAGVCSASTASAGVEHRSAVRPLPRAAANRRRPAPAHGVHEQRIRVSSRCRPGPPPDAAAVAGAFNEEAVRVMAAALAIGRQRGSTPRSMLRLSRRGHVVGSPRTATASSGGSR